MKRVASLLLGLVAVVCFFVASERTALAYVDPGSGLLALQGLASLVGTAAFYFRRRLKVLFKRKNEVPAGTFPAKAKREPQNAG
jgi:hypothetical protein